MDVISGAVAVLVPAHNEAAQIVATLESLLKQTVKPWRIYVIADNCTDQTASLARAFQDPAVEVVRTYNNEDKKAGGMNHLLDRIEKLQARPEFVLTMDADTYFVPDFIEKSIRVLNARPDVGAVTGPVRVKYDWADAAPMARLLGWLQAVEYSRYAFWQMRGNAFTLSGAGSLYRTEAILGIKALRSRKGQVFKPRSRVEDFVSGLDIERLGWKTLKLRGLEFRTETMPTINAWMRQRRSWVLGILGETKDYGSSQNLVSRIAQMSMQYLILFLNLVLYAVMALLFVFSAQSIDYTYMFVAGACSMMFIAGVNAVATWREGWGAKRALACFTVVPQMFYSLLGIYCSLACLAALFRGRRASW